MRFPYSTTDPAQDAFDSLPRLPLRLHADSRAIDVMGLVDGGATVNVLPSLVDTMPIATLQPVPVVASDT
jgi:hypothetical protein